MSVADPNTDGPVPRLPPVNVVVATHNRAVMLQRSIVVSPPRLLDSVDGVLLY